MDVDGCGLMLMDVDRCGWMCMWMDVDKDVDKDVDRCGCKWIDVDGWDGCGYG